MDLGAADADFDLRFIDAMIPHHQGAIDMAEEALKKSERTEIKQLADGIIESQQKEITQMEEWRKDWYPKAGKKPATGSSMGKSAKQDMMKKMDGNLGATIEKQIKLGSFKRLSVSTLPTFDEENRTVTFSFSSTAPVTRIDWDEWEQFEEVLSHSTSAVDLNRVSSDACPLLWNHASDDQRGKILSVDLVEDRAIAKAKLSRSVKGEELWQDMKDGIATSASFMYRVHEYEETAKADPKKGKLAQRTATKWSLLEVSICPIPADPSVGVGRGEVKEDPNQVRVRGIEENMDIEDKTKGAMEKRLEALEAESLAHAKALADKDDQILRLTRQKEISQTYNSLRAQAEQLRADMKLPLPEFNELFGNVDDDVKSLIENVGSEKNLDAIAFYLGKASKRNAMLNTDIKTNNQPLPDKPGIPQADDKKAQELVDFALNQRIVS